MCLEERIIATYFTLIQQPIYHLSFCGNLLASPALDVHPYYLCFYMDFNSPDTDDEDDVHVARPGLVPVTEAAGDTCY